MWRGREATVVRLFRGQFEKTNAAVGSRDPEHAIGVFHVGGGRFQRLGREVLAIRDRFLRGDVQRGAGGEQAARAGATEALRASGWTGEE